MILTKKEIEILSLMNEVPVENFMERTKRHTNYTKKEIEKIIKKLLKEKYVEIIAIPQGDKEVDWYFPTGKGESNPFDDNLRWLKDFGEKFGQGRNNGPLNKLKKFIKNGK